MSEPWGPKKQHIEKVMEDAWEWWSKLEEFQQEDYIFQAYCKEKKIGQEEIEF